MYAGAHPLTPFKFAGLGYPDFRPEFWLAEFWLEALRVSERQPQVDETASIYIFLRGISPGWSDSTRNQRAVPALRKELELHIRHPHSRKGAGPPPRR